MRIAQVAPLYVPVPPTDYGGTERIVYTLTEELVKSTAPAAATTWCAASHRSA